MTPDTILRRMTEATRTMQDTGDRLHAAVRALHEHYAPHQARGRAADNYACTAHKLVSKYANVLQQVVPDDELERLTQARRRWLGAPGHNQLSTDDPLDQCRPADQRRYLQAGRRDLDDAMINYARTCYDIFRSRPLDEPMLLDPEDIESIHDAESAWASAAEQVRRIKLALAHAEARERGEISDDDEPEEGEGASPRLDS